MLQSLVPGPARAAQLPEARLAREAAEWLLARAQPDGEGLVWPEIAGESALSLDLYSGSAGVLLALLAAHEATGEERLTEAARKSVAGLLARAERVPGGLFWNTVLRDREGHPGKRIGAGLYTGTAGIAVALLEAGERLGIEQALAAGREGFSWVASQGRAAEGGGLWWEAGCSDVISGNAGILLALLRAYELLGDEQLLACAARAGQALLGLRTGRGEFLEAAKRGADFLWQVRVEDESGIRWQRGLDENGRKGEEREGWCHGIAGTARLFLLLHGISGEPRHLEAVARGWSWMAGKYRPDRERAASRFWSPSLCCGAAGVGEFMLEVYRHTGDPEALAYAVETARWLERIADRPEPGQACWSLTPRPDPRLGRVAQRTSLMLGAAGQLLFLSRLAAIRSGVPGSGPMLPDQRGLAGPPGRRALVALLGPGAERYRRTARLYQALRGAELGQVDLPAALTELVRARAADQVALVVAPEALDINLHRAVVDALCRVDDDPFADAGFGYLTGRTPAEAEALVARAAQVKAEGVPPRLLRIAVASNLTRALHVPPRPAASALLPGWTEESFYLNTVENNPACRDDVPRALARIPGQGALLLTGCGDPIKTWLFSDRRNLDPSKHWPFDPARIRADLDDPEMPGLGASDLAGIAFGPLVVSTGVCHHGVPLRALVEGDIVSTFGQSGTGAWLRLRSSVP